MALSRGEEEIMPRWPVNRCKRMRITTVAMPEHLFKIFAAFVEKGVVPSRSEGIRLAISHGLPILTKMVNNQEQIINECEISVTNHTPSNKIYVPKGDGTYEQYLKVGEA